MRSYSLSPKAEKVLIKCIRESKVDIYKDKFELFPILEILESKLRTKKGRDDLKLGTTGEIMRGIQYLKENKLV